MPNEITPNQLRYKRIKETDQLPAPKEIIRLFPTNSVASSTVIKGREMIERILRKEEKKLLVIVGPCSIHDPKAAVEYAQNLCSLQERTRNIYIVMRTYFEKPRTTLGWTGLIMDPYLDNSGKVEDGIIVARNLLIEINSLGIPCATEALYIHLVPYFSDLISWYSIGARNVESQPHRQMASALSASVGFKNNTDGNIQVAVDAIKVASKNHNNFVGISDDGNLINVKTIGNPLSHLVLRGGKNGPNYKIDDVKKAIEMLEKANVEIKTMIIDCNHGNSQKDLKKQIEIALYVLQNLYWKLNVIGIMIESNLKEGKQDFDPEKDDKEKLEYGKSITDPCLGWNDTEALLIEIDKMLDKGTI